MQEAQGHDELTEAVEQGKGIKESLHARRMQLAEAAEEALAGLRATVGRRGACRSRASQAALAVRHEAELMGHAGAALCDIIAWRV